MPQVLQKGYIVADEKYIVEGCDKLDIHTA